VHQKARAGETWPADAQAGAQRKQPRWDGLRSLTGRAAEGLPGTALGGFVPLQGGQDGRQRAVERRDGTAAAGTDVIDRPSSRHAVKSQ